MLVGLVNMPSTLIVAIRLWTAAVCLGAVLLVQRWRSGRAVGDVRAGDRAGVGSGTGSLDTARSAVSAPRPMSVYPMRCVVTAVTLGAHWLALFAAYQRAPAGTVILIVYMAPLGVAALAPRFLGEPLGRGTVVALAAAVAGFGLLAGPTVQSAGAAGLLLSLVAMVLFVFLILLSKPLAAVYGGLRLAFLELAGAGVVLIPVALATAWPSPRPAWLWIMVLGVVHTALGISLYLSVLARVPATHVGIISYLEPVVVVLAAWVWLGQRPALVTVVGGSLVVAAGVSIALSGSGPSGRPRRVGAVVGSVDPVVPAP